MQRIIKYTLDTGDTSILDKVPRALVTEQELEYIDWIKTNETIYGELPSIEDFKLQFPMYIELPYHSKGGLLRQFIERKKKNAIHETLASIDPNDLDEATKQINNLRDKLTMGPSELLSMSHISRTRMYGKFSKSHFIISPEVTHKLDGIKDGDVFTIIGRYGSGKSAVIENSIVRWLMDGERVLVISNDMSTTATAMRLDSFLVHRDVSKMDKSELPILDKVCNLVYNALDGQIILPSKPVQYVSEIIGIAKQQKATILVVDGAYLVKSEKSKDKGSRNWEAMSDTSGELTWLAHTLNIPVILVSQANRSGDVAYSNSLAQDSDILVKLDDEVEVVSDEEHIKVVQISTMKNRRGGPYKGHIQIDFQNYTVYDTKFQIT